EYWGERLAGAEPLEIPSDRPRPEVPTNRGARLVYAVPVEVLEEFRGLAQRHGVTLYAALLAATNAVLCRWTGQEDVVIGTAVPGRRSSQLEELVGCLINMVVLRTDLSGDPTFAELIARSRIERLLQQFERVIRAAVADDSLRLSELPLLSEDERELMLEEWGRGPLVDQPHVPVHTQIAERAAAQPDMVAARIEGH